MHGKAITINMIAEAAILPVIGVVPKRTLLASRPRSRHKPFAGSRMSLEVSMWRVSPKTRCCRKWRERRIVHGKHRQRSGQDILFALLGGVPLTSLCLPVSAHVRTTACACTAASSCKVRNVVIKFLPFGGKGGETRLRYADYHWCTSLQDVLRVCYPLMLTKKILSTMHGVRELLKTLPKYVIPHSPAAWPQ